MIAPAKDDMPAVYKYRCSCNETPATTLPSDTAAVSQPPPASVSCRGTIEFRCAVDRSHSFLVGERITLKITHPARKA
jgi:hypothetical protein